MNRNMILYTLGKVVLFEGITMIIPIVVGLIYGESIIPFVKTMVLACAIGCLLQYPNKTKAKRLFSKDGYVIVTLAWIVISVIGALPFYLGGAIPSYVDALFETISGFTTTGASILADVEAMDKCLLFWRSFTHWFGGMGVLIFILAVAERNPNRSINIMRAEMPGSKVDKLKPKAKSTAKILYFIYIAMTVLEIIFLLIGGMPLFDSVVHSLGTAGTGGFGIHSDSIGGYSPYLQYVIAIFMLIFAINFSIYYLVLAGRWKAALKSPELKWFLGIVALAVAIIMIANQNIYPDRGEDFRLAFFQVSSIISTTGYSTTDFNLWPDISKAVLLLLMFIGGCEGSTAGGFKISRVMILFHSIRNEMKHLLHPRMVRFVRINEKVVPPQTVVGVGSYLSLYLLTGAVIFLIISAEPMGLETNLSAVVACFNNIGPGLAGVGPAANFAAYSDLSKMVLSAAMLLGRLEIYPILLSLSVERSWNYQ